MLGLINVDINANLITILSVIFSAGFLSGLSPCSLPTVALVVAYVSGKTGGEDKNKIRGLILSLSFVLGITVTLALLGLFAGSLGSVLAKSVVFIYVVAVILIFMGLWMLKIFKIGESGKTLLYTPKKKGTGLIGAFLIGLPFGIAASPCTMPVTFAVMAFAVAKGSPVYGILFLSVFAIGRSIPLLVAGTFTGILKNMKFLEKYQSIFEKAGGAVLIVIGVFFLATS